MKKLNLSYIVLALLIFSLSGCADKFTIDVWKLPKTGKTLKGIEYVVIQRDRVYYQDDLFDYALREALANNSQYKVIPQIKEKTALKRLDYFNYNMKDKDKKETTAYISFKVDDNYSHTVVHNRHTQTLRSCNYLREKDKCWNSGSATLHNGSREVVYSYNVTVNIKDVRGENLIPAKTIKKSYKYDGKFAPDAIILQSMFAKSVALDIIKGISPYKMKEEIDFIGGDSLAQTMIENRAYRLAVDRIQSLGEDKNDPENLYMTGLCFEAMEEFSGAFNFYSQAATKLPENDVIKKSLNRISWSAEAKEM